jgi:flagellar hook-associated protein 1
MSLIGALNAGKTALATHQAAIQVIGNNISNAGNADYTRQVANLTPVQGQQVSPGIFIGAGVNLDSVQRQIDEALEGRLRNSISDQSSADATQQWLSRIESIFNELGNDDLSTQLSNFFNSWSNLANNPQDQGLRQVVIQNGDSVAKWLNNIRNDLGSLRDDVDDRMQALTTNADQLAQQVADLNQQIVTAEGGNPGQANGLRDQRDVVLKQLADLVDVKTINRGNQVDVYIGSEPLVAGTLNRGLTLKQEVVNGDLQTSLAFKADNGTVNVTGGQLGALAQIRSNDIANTINQVDSITGALIFELNKLHASGQGLQGYTTTTSTNVVDDPTVALNDPDSGLKFAPGNGSFVIHVKQKSSGLETSTLVQVDLDGLNGNDTTLNSLTADIDSINGISATVTAGKLKITADSTDVEFSFSQDSSGTLAALGINSFFTGDKASNIAVNPVVANQPSLLAAAKNGQSGDNQTARDIAALQTTALSSLSGATLNETYQSMINTIATSSQTAQTNADAAQVVQQTLESQREALSGVSLDEEAINLIKEQRAFQGAARLVAAVDEMLKTVLDLV